MSAAVLKKIETNLFRMFREEVLSFLTTEDWDDNEEFGEPDLGKGMPDEDAEEIFKIIQDDVRLIMNDMIQTYKEDGDLDELKKPMPDWIREFLYDEKYEMEKLLIELRK